MLEDLPWYGQPKNIAWALDTITLVLTPGEFCALYVIYAASYQLFFRNIDGVWVIDNESSCHAVK
jgi:hypothetical protein